MKKFLLALVMIVPMFAFTFPAEAKKKGSVKMKLISSSVDYKKFTTDSIIDASFYKSGDSFITVYIRNKTDKKIVIEWEGATVDYGKVIFDTDRPITMDSQPKTEEVVYPHRSSNIKEITSRYKYMSSGLYPLYKEKELKKGKVENVKVSIPIRTDNGDTRVYDYELQYRFVEE